jgi:hypothetical protein
MEIGVPQHSQKKVLIKIKRYRVGQRRKYPILSVKGREGTSSQILWHFLQ